jgi:hypothetical protein
VNKNTKTVLIVLGICLAIGMVVAVLGFGSAA